MKPEHSQFGHPEKTMGDEVLTAMDATQQPSALATSAAASVLLVGKNLLGIYITFGALIAWMVALSYTAGERAKQMDINTARLDRLELNGSPGLRPQLEEINRRLDGIERRMDAKH
jgi:hypothetical protein